MTIYIDATRCYDRVAHLFISLCAQYYGLDTLHLVVLFRANQSIKMFLRTPFRVYQSFYSGNEEKLFKGAVQGSRAAPAL